MRLGPRTNKSEEMVQCKLGRLIKALLVVRCICLMSLGSLEEGSLRPSLSIGGSNMSVGPCLSPLLCLASLYRSS